MLLVDVHATLRHGEWMAATRGGKTLINIDSDLVPVELGMSSGGIGVGGLCVASWRWDLAHRSDGRRVSLRNVHTVVRKAEKQGFKYVAIDYMSVHQGSETSIFVRELVEFSELYNSSAPVVTAYGSLGATGTLTVRRAWIRSELTAFALRMQIRDTFDVDGWWVYGPSGLYHLYQMVAVSEGSIKGLDPFSFVVYWTYRATFGLLEATVILWAVIALRLPFVIMKSLAYTVRWGRPRGWLLEDVATQERAEAWAHKVDGIERWAMSVDPPGRLYFAATWLTGINAFLTFVLLRARFSVSRTTLEKFILFAVLRSREPPALYFGDCMHIIAKAHRNGVLATSQRTNEDAFHVLHHFAELAYGKTICIGRGTCLECRLRTAFVLTLVVVASTHLANDNMVGKRCFGENVTLVGTSLTSFFNKPSPSDHEAHRAFAMTTRQQVYNLAKKSPGPDAALLATEGNRHKGCSVTLDLVGIPGVECTRYTTERPKFKLLNPVMTEEMHPVTTEEKSSQPMQTPHLAQQTTLSVGESYAHLLGVAIEVMRSCHCCTAGEGDPTATVTPPSVAIV